MSPLTPRITVIGEALVDIVSATGTAHVGGSPLNVAVGLSRLGLPTRLQTRVGADGHGALITDLLSREGVQVPEDVATAQRTSTATVTLDVDGAAVYDFALDWDIDTPDLSDTTVLHTGSIGAVLEPGGTVARDAVGSAGDNVLRSYDPNVRPDIMGDPGAARRLIRDLAARCHVVKFSDEDAAWLGEDSGAGAQDVVDVLAAVADSGPRFTVMTRGGHGCTAVVDGTTYTLPASVTTVVDTIGAGDAFMSGLLFALVSSGADRLLVDGRPLTDAQVTSALQTALDSAAVAVSRAGAQPPYPADLSSTA